jgi:hypothetical protein
LGNSGVTVLKEARSQVLINNPQPSPLKAIPHFLNACSFFLAERFFRPSGIVQNLAILARDLTGMEDVLDDAN